VPPSLPYRSDSFEHDDRLTRSRLRQPESEDCPEPADDAVSREGVDLSEPSQSVNRLALQIRTSPSFALFFFDLPANFFLSLATLLSILGLHRRVPFDGPHS
jgi:hypothetical protein